MKELWSDEYENWSRRSLAGKKYVYLWADGVYFNCRLSDEKPCVLVLIGATEDRRKELIAIVDGERESEQSWIEVLLSVKARGLTDAPHLDIGDGAMVFKLSQKARSTWRKLNGSALLSDVVTGLKFVDGVKQAA